MLAPGAGQLDLKFKVDKDAKPGKYNAVLTATGLRTQEIEFTVAAPAPEEGK